MRNLKRVLSLSLAVIMLIGMMVMGVSAADFTDQAEIKNADAVKTLVALNIISGKGDGSYFDPNGIVTRAEMAKMLTVALNGGETPVLGGGVSFTDTEGHWAAAYIEYCASLGIVAGRGNGTFDPNATVTGTEAAKMMLVAMKYDADVFGLVGGNWDNNTNVEANAAGLYKDLLGIDPSVGMTRDNAAQLIYNGILAKTMYLSWGQNLTTGQITQNYNRTGASIFEDKYNGRVAEGLLWDYSYDSQKAEWTYAIGAVQVEENAKPEAVVARYELPSAEDYCDLYMMNVEALYTVEKNGDIKTYGIYAKKAQVLAEGVVGDISYGTNDDMYKDKEFKFAGVKYKLDEAAKLDLIGQNVTKATYDKYDAARVIDNDGDNKADWIVVNPIFVGKVGYVGKTITTDLTVQYLGSQKVEDVIVAEGIAKDDYVAVTKDCKGKWNYAEIAKTTGKITDTKDSGKGTYSNVALDGTYYKNVSVATTTTLGSTIDAYIVNGYIARDVTAATAMDGSKYVVVTAVETKATGLNEYPQAKLLFTDGTTKVVDVDPAKSANQGDLVTYKVNSDGIYELTAAGDDTVKTNSTYCGFGFADMTGLMTYDKDDAEVGGYAVADDAVIFVKKPSATAPAGFTWKVISGATYKAEGATAGADGMDTFSHVYGSENKATGYVSVQLGYVTSKLPNASSYAYGYITAKLEATKNADDENVYKVTFWNGAETLTLATKYGVDLSAKYDLGDGAKGLVIKYKTSGGVISEINFVGVTTSVVAYDGTNIKFVDDAGKGTDYVIDEKTVVIYVDGSDKTAVEGGAISLATKTDSATWADSAVAEYYDNVIAFDSGDKNSDGDYTVEVIVVDITNGIH